MEKDIQFTEFNGDRLAGDGYPSENFLKWIGELSPEMAIYYPHKVLEEIAEAWHLKDWGWRKCDAIDDFKKEIVRYHISTAGWSGNESLIYALEKSKCLFWSFYWQYSRRGGHYVFEVPKKINREKSSRDV